ncbi:MAG: IS200/IS605 family transposase [Clostridium sp.]
MYSIFMAWEPGNLKADTNTYYNITLFSSANIEKKLLVSRQISDDIKQFSYEICQRHSVIIRYMETDKDHIHYMIETEPTMSISKIVNLMKSYTTYHIWKRYPQYLRKQFWKEHTFWTDGYFACSVGNVSEEMLKRYIENQG